MRLSIFTLLLAAVVSWGAASSNPLDFFGYSNGEFLIQSADDLMTLATYVNTGDITTQRFRLTTDITVTSSFKGIGTSKPFRGTFDGDNHTIKGLSLSCADYTDVNHYCGLFGENRGTIKNVRLQKATIYESQSGNVQSSAVHLYIGGIAGYNSGTISGCHVDTISITSYDAAIGAEYSSFAGGIAGRNSGTIDSCKVTKANISNSDYYYRGGITGALGPTGAAKITNCEVRSSNIKANGYAGGIIGQFGNSNGTIQNNIVIGTSVSGSSNYGQIYGSSCSSCSASNNYYYNSTNSNILKLRLISSSANACKATFSASSGFTYANEGYYKSGTNVTFKFTANTGYGCKFTLGSEAPKLYYSNNTATVKMNSDTTAIIADSARNYSITYNLSEHGTNPPDAPQTYTINDKVTLPTPTPAAGYLFYGWSSSSGFVTSIPKGSTGDKSFDAFWQKDIATHPDITINEIPDQVWTGSAIKPTVTIKDTTADIMKYMGNIVYTGTDVGEGTIRITPPQSVSGAINTYGGEVVLTYNIVKATPTVTPPVPVELTFKNRYHWELVTAGTTNMGTMLYSLDGETFSEEIPTAMNAGTYTVYYKVSLSESEKEHYEEVSGSVQATIKKAPQHIQMITGDFTYDGTSHSLILIVSSNCTAFVSENGTDYIQATHQNLPRATDAGTYTIWVKEDPENCEGDPIVTHPIIRKATPTVTAPTANDITFNGEAQELVTAGSTDFGTLLYSLDGTNFSEQIPTATNAGTYTVHYMVEETGNWEQILNSTDVVIGKKAIDQLQITGNELTYNGEAQELVSANSSSHMCTVYSLDDENYSKEIPKGQNAGPYAVYYKLDMENCSGNATGGTVDVMIYAVKLSAPPTGTKLLYNGEAQELATTAQPSFCRVKYSIDGGQTFQREIPTAVDAGTYQIIYQVDNRNCGGKNLEGKIESVISPANVTEPKPRKLVYNGNPQELVAAGFPSSCLSYSLDKENYSEKIPTAVDARKYDVYFKVTNLQNCNEYEGLISTGIEPAQPKVNDPEARKLVYNGEAQELVTEGYANSGPMLYSLDGVNFSEEIPTAVDAGKYEIVVLVKATENYISYNKTITAYIDKLKTNEIYPIQGNKLVFNGKAQKLITAKGPNICLVYNVQTQTSISGFSKEFPTATNSDDYLITYKFDDNNCVGNNVEDAVNATIKPAAITLPPQAKQLAYTGEPQELVSKGYPEFCLTYSLDKKNFSENVPTGTKMGEYSVFYKVDERNCKGESGVLVSYIADRLPDLTIVAPRTEKILLYTGKEQPLLEREGYVEMGQMLYSLNGVHFNEKIPTATDPGFYTIYYRALFKDFILEEGTVSTIIAEDPLNFAFVDLFRIGKKIYAAIDGNYSDDKEFRLIDTRVDTVIFNREFAITEGNNYSTLMLPFNAKLEQVTGIKENNIFEFAGVGRNKETGALQVEIARAKSITAYTPYIVQMSSPTLQFKGSIQLLSQDKNPIVDSKEWTFVGTLQYTKWDEKNKETGHVYGFSAKPFETTSGKQCGAGQFIKFGKNSFIKPLRAYLRYEGNFPIKNYAPSPYGYEAPTASIDEDGLPDQMEVVIVERDENGTEEHTTVIGKFNTRTGEFKMLRNYDLKGRKVNSTNKAHKAYYGKKVLKK